MGGPQSRRTAFKSHFKHIYTEYLPFNIFNTFLNYTPCTIGFRFVSFAAEFYPQIMKKLLVWLLYTFLATQALLAQEKYTLSGYVKDGDTGEELIGATIFVNETKGGTITNVYGFYSITLPKGTYTVTYSFLGKESFTKTINLTQAVKLDAELKESGVELKVVEIEAERTDANVSSTEMSVVQMDMKQVKAIPQFLGEVDVLKTIQLLPGVQSGGEGSTGFFVRGGGADQNLIMLDEAVVYNASHLFNFFSVFNPDAVKDLKLYKGGIPARYGGRLSSVLDIRMNDGNKRFKQNPEKLDTIQNPLKRAAAKTYNRVYGNGGIGLISSRLTLQGPIAKDKSSFLITGRRTYADLFLNFSPDTAIRGNKLYFYDLNAKLNYTINDNNRLFLSGYFGRDVTGFGDLFGFDWGNATGTLRWNHLFSDKLFSNFSLIYTNYVFNIRGDVNPFTFDWNSMINDYNVKADFSYYANSKNTIRWGVNAVYHNLDPGTFLVTFDGDTIENGFTRLSPNNGFEYGIYASNEQEINDKISLTYGIRASLFQRVGPGKKYFYDKTNPQKWVVSETVDRESGKVDETFWGIEPRFTFRYGLNSSSSIKSSYNRMIQYIQQSQSSQSVAPYDVWYMASHNIPPQIADQIALGYFKNFKNNTYETSVEAYYKRITNLTDLIDNADVLGNELLESQLRVGNGNAWGIEFMAKKQTGLLTGWVSYTYAHTQRTIPEINNGEPYYAPFDRRHDASVTGAYQLTDRIAFSANFVYSTGRALTFPIGKFEYQGTVAPIFDSRNASRLPEYHRLDLGLTIDPRPNANKKFTSSWSFSVYNVYARKNPISVSFKEDPNNAGGAITTMFYLPGPIPSVTWNFKF